MMKYVDESKMNKILVAGIILLSVSLISIVTLKVYDMSNSESDLPYWDTENEQSGNRDLFIYQDAPLFNMVQIDDDIINLLLIVDESYTDDSIVSSGFYIVSIDLRNGDNKTVAIYPHILMDAFNRKNLLLSDVREKYGIHNTINVINNYFRLDIEGYMAVDYRDLSYLMKLLELEYASENIESGTGSLYDGFLHSVSLNEVKIDLMTSILDDNPESQDVFDEFLKQTSILKQIHGGLGLKSSPVLYADITSSFYKRIETNYELHDFQQLISRIMYNERETENLVVPVDESWEYVEDSNKVVRPYRLNRTKIRSFLYE